MHAHRIPFVALALLLAACGDAGGAPSPAASGTSEPGSADDAQTVECGGSTYDPTALTDAPRASALPDGPAGAVDDAGAPAFDPTQDWRVVHQSEDRVELVRVLEEPTDHGGGDVRTHESRVLERITGATDVPEGTWLLTFAGPCTPRTVGGDDLGEADLTLATEPSPDTTTLDLLVHERACASGQPADGRVELVELDQTADAVRLRIGVRPRPGGQDCQGNPPTPFTVELDAPLGDREVLDASVVPARPLTVDGSQPDEADAGG